MSRLQQTARQIGIWRAILTKLQKKYEDIQDEAKGKELKYEVKIRKKNV